MKNAKLPLYIFLFITGFYGITAFSTVHGDDKGILHINFINIANGKPIVLLDSSYTNASGEIYSINKLKYYISNIIVGENSFESDEENYQLIDLASKTDFYLPVKEGKYNKISFLLGVDSLRNCSGAQDGALDPMNDMFWTWNSGYVMFKLEGRSNASNNRKRIEHHVGGYRSGENVATPVVLNFAEKKVKASDTTILNIYMDLDKYWAGNNSISIAEFPVCTLPGTIAKRISENFRTLFRTD